MSKVFGVTGWKNSGKTTLVCKLVSEFTARGFRVSTVKNAHHNFSIDTKGTDSYAHREAGAGEVALVSDKRWVLMHEVQSNGAMPSLETILGKLAPCDLVLVEGFKKSAIPKIECRREGSIKDDPIWPNNESVIALASEKNENQSNHPHFLIDDVSGIADFIAQTVGLGL
ncbi:MAG: molybdopterin-guanine dinucleotide biosynthesis protein B [Rhizobiaceae bacterium]